MAWRRPHPHEELGFRTSSQRWPRYCPQTKDADRCCNRCCRTSAPVLPDAKTAGRSRCLAAAACSTCCSPMHSHCCGYRSLTRNHPSARSRMCIQRWHFSRSLTHNQTRIPSRIPSLADCFCGRNRSHNPSSMPCSLDCRRSMSVCVCRCSGRCRRTMASRRRNSEVTCSWWSNFRSRHNETHRRCHRCGRSRSFWTFH